MGHMLLCEDVAMDWNLDDVLEIREAREKERRAAIAEARRREWIADMRLGRAIANARDRGVPQHAIADALKLSREQVRRLQATWTKTFAAGGVSDADLDN